jgi:flagellar biosynthesis protein FlhF
VIVKKFAAKDLQEAMGKIRREMGPDAVMLGSKEVRKKGFLGLFSPKIVEVTAVYEPLGSKAAAKKKEPGGKKEEQSLNLDKLNERLSALQNTVDRFAGRMERSARAFSPEISILYERLLKNDVCEEVARMLAEEVTSATAKSGVEPEAALEQLIIEKLGEPAPLKLKKFKQNTVMIAGPTGVGKTTTLVKLAGLFSYAQGLKVGLVNTDTYRIAAREQLKTYADIMDIPVDTVYSSADLNTALKTQQDLDVVLIDTAGKSPHDKGYISELKELIHSAQIDEVLLTLSINTGERALKEIIGKYAFLQNCKVVVTKLDEIRSWGNALNIAVYTGKPISYTTAGQSVPDDIEQMDVKKMAKNILGQVGDDGGSGARP